MPSSGRFSRVLVRTLNPTHYTADALLNAYLALLGNESTKVLNVDFSFNIVARDLPTFLSWGQRIGLAKSNVKRIVFPLRSSTKAYWALAVIQRDEEMVKVFDFLPSKQAFQGLFAKILTFANCLLCDNAKRFELIERTDVVSTAIRFIDAPIWMLYQAFLAVNEKDGPYVPTKSITEIRSIFRDSILQNRIIEMVPPSATPPEAHLADETPFFEAQDGSVFDTPHPVDGDAVANAGGLLASSQNQEHDASKEAAKNEESEEVEVSTENSATGSTIIRRNSSGGVDKTRDISEGSALQNIGSGGDENRSAHSTTCNVNSIDSGGDKGIRQLRTLISREARTVRRNHLIP